MKSFLYSFILLIMLANTLQLNAQVFEEVSRQRGIQHKAYEFVSGVVVWDYNNDGWDDIFLPSGLYEDSSKLYRNDNGHFTDVTVASGVGILNDQKDYTVGGASADLDNDGYRELIVTKYLCNGGSCALILFKNNGNGTFTDITPASGINVPVQSKAVSFADVNMDGYLDIYFSRYDEGTHYTYDSLLHITGYSTDCLANYFFINNKNMTFTDKTSDYQLANSGCTFTSIFTDFDNDHDPDLLVTNDFGDWSNWKNALYKNNYPSVAFTDVSSSSNMMLSLYCMGIATGDYNNDGWLDYYFTNIGKNVFMRNNGNGTFTNVAGLYGVENEWSITDSLYQTSWGCNFFDADNDGDEDLFVSSGWYNIQYPLTGTYSPNKFYRNNNYGQSFTDISASAGIANPLTKSGSAILDFDNDGKMDIINIASDLPRPNEVIDSAHTLLYRNITSNSNSYIKIKLKGIKSNRDGFGSHIEVYANGRKYLREPESGGNSHASQSTSYIHFGLGNASLVDSIHIIWPGGRIQTLQSISVNQTLTVTEDTTIALISATHKNQHLMIYPNVMRTPQDIQIYLPEGSEPLFLYITDVTGKIIYTRDLSSTRSYISLQCPETIYSQPGYYILTITDKSQETYSSHFLILK